MKRAFLSGVFAFVLLAVSPAAEKSFSPVDYVNPFIGTTNFGTTNPGAVCPITLKGTTDIIPLGQTAPGLVVPKLVVPIKGFT
jgi:hypothetical protein